MLKRSIARLLIITLGGATLGVSATLVGLNWQLVADAMPEVHGAWLGAGGAVLVCCYGVLGLGWWIVLRGLGADLTAPIAFRAYALSQLPKYVPGRMAGHGVKVVTVARAGVAVPIGVLALAIEGMLGIVAAVAIAMAGGRHIKSLMPAGHDWLASAAIALAAGGAAVAAIRYAVGRRQLRSMDGVFKVRADLLVGASILYLGVWILIGFANWLIANAVIRLPLEMLPAMIVAVAVATVAGHAAVVAPGGIGVREGALYLFVRAWMPDDRAIVFVALTRLVAVLIEAALTIGAALYSKRWPVANAEAESSP